MNNIYIFNRNKLKSNARILFSTILCCILLTGCKDISGNNTDTPDVSVTAVPTEQADYVNPNISADITSVPDIDSVEEPAISIEEAKLSILGNLDITKYHLDLLNNSLLIGGNEYYLFFVKENNLIHTPALVVDKETGNVYCYETDGTINPFTDFQFYIENNNMYFDWNGNYIHYNDFGNPAYKIELSQSDSHSFSFVLEIADGFYNTEIVGFAEISNNTAIYYLNDKPVLLFVINDNTLLVSYISAHSSIAETYDFSEIFYLDGADIPASSIISEDEARSLLLSLSIKETELPDEISKYIIIPDKMTIFIKGEPCYSFGVYVNASNRKMLINTYYVAMDGSKIFMFDPEIVDDVLIYESVQM